MKSLKALLCGIVMVSTHAGAQDERSNPSTSSGRSERENIIIPVRARSQDERSGHLLRCLSVDLSIVA